MDVHRPVGASVRHPPDMREQVPPGDYLPRVRSQVVQQLELAPAEVKAHPVEGDLMGARVQPEAAHLKWLTGLRDTRFRTSQDRPDPASIWSALNGLIT